MTEQKEPQTQLSLVVPLRYKQLLQVCARYHCRSMTAEVLSCLIDRFQRVEYTVLITLLFLTVFL